MSQPICAACGKPSERQFSIHRDYGMEGPEVWLCNECGEGELPTLPQLWKEIRHRWLEGFTICEVDKI